MSQRMVRLIFFMAWGVFLISCNRSPKPPPASAISAQTKPEAARPTTQELLSGPYKRMVLPGMPLAIQVPQSWKIEVDGSLTFLQGPTPTDNAIIQLAQRESARPDQIEILLAGIKREQEQHPNTIKRADLPNIGDMKIIEQISISQPITTPKVDASGIGMVDKDGNPLTVTLTAANWKLTVLVPFEKMYSRY